MSTPTGPAGENTRPRLVIGQGDGYREAITTSLVTSGQPREFDYPPYLPDGYTASHFSGFGRRLLEQLRKLSAEGCDVQRILRFGVRYTTPHEWLLPWPAVDNLIVVTFTAANGGRPFDVVRDTNWAGTWPPSTGQEQGS